MPLKRYCPIRKFFHLGRLSSVDAIPVDCPQRNSWWLWPKGFQTKEKNGSQNANQATQSGRPPTIIREKHMGGCGLRSSIEYSFACWLAEHRIMTSWLSRISHSAIFQFATSIELMAIPRQTKGISTMMHSWNPELTDVRVVGCMCRAISRRLVLAPRGTRSRRCTASSCRSRGWGFDLDRNKLVL